jgi:hypothetical protein
MSTNVIHDLGVDPAGLIIIGVPAAIAGIT